MKYVAIVLLGLVSAASLVALGQDTNTVELSSGEQVDTPEEVYPSLEGADGCGQPESPQACMTEEPTDGLAKHHGSLDRSKLLAALTDVSPEKSHALQGVLAQMDGADIVATVLLSADDHEPMTFPHPVFGDVEASSLRVEGTTRQYPIEMPFAPERLWFPGGPKVNRSRLPGCSDHLSGGEHLVALRQVGSDFIERRCASWPVSDGLIRTSAGIEIPIASVLAAHAQYMEL